MKTFTTLTSIVATLLFTSTDAAARGAAPRYERQATVYVADLDLAREPDALALYERIRYAAAAICTMDDASPDARERRRQRECADAAVTEAVERVNTPLLTTLHRE